MLLRSNYDLQSYLVGSLAEGVDVVAARRYMTISILQPGGALHFTAVCFCRSTPIDVRAITDKNRLPAGQGGNNPHQRGGQSPGLPGFDDAAWPANVPEIP
jgi:hypothetical protein